MEKLERILDVEERASHLVADARERAAVIERDARAASVRVRQSMKSEARAAVEADTAELLARTREEAERVAVQAAAERAVVMDAAQARVADAVQTVLRGLAD